MKKFSLKLLSILCALVLLISVVSCNKTEASTGLWENATYKSSTEIGNGSKSIEIEIVIDADSIVLEINTDKENVGEALFELGLINDASFFDTLNGIKADWAKDKAYWGFYLENEMLPYGVSDAKINGGEHYRFVYTK